jgi:general secretion pathway protein G
MEPLPGDCAVSTERDSRVGWYIAAGVIAAMLGVTLCGPGRSMIGGPTEGGRRAQAASDLAILSTAIDAFRDDCGRCPTAAEGLNALLAQPLDMKFWNGPYAKRVYVDPWGAPYIYVPPPPGGSTAYQLISAGRDGKVGTADDVAGTGPGIPFNP